MPYEQKTQEIALESLESILSEAEADLIEGLDQIYEVFDETIGLANQELYEISEDMLELISDVEEPLERQAQSNVTHDPHEILGLGMGVYQITARRKAKNAPSHAALRHLRRAHRLFARLHADGALLPEEEEVYQEISNFLARNDLF
jgi:hypothetical protein